MLDSNISLKEYVESLPPADQSIIKSEIFNIFRLNPWLSKLYAAHFAYTGRNPFEIKNIQPRSEFFFEADSTLTHPKGKTKMAATKPVPICTHIKPSGHRCGSPALRGEVFCYFHQRMIRGVRTPPKSRLHPIAILDDPESIQASLMEIINALVRDTIDYRRAQLILRALHMAAKNSRNVDFEYKGEPIVHEVPNYPKPRGPRKPKPLAPYQPPVLPWEEKDIPEHETWNWDKIWKNVQENIAYDPKNNPDNCLPPLPPLTASSNSSPTERKPPQSVKLPLQSGSSSPESNSQLIAGATPP
jgi:hypothetical protein